jgi:hypothetical protein
MPLSPREIIAVICPELSGSPSLPVYLEMAAEVTSRGFFGNVYNQAAANLAAHKFTVDGSGSSSTVNTIKELGGGAQIASMSEGGLSVSFAQSGGTAGDSDLNSTRYGREYLRLKRSRVRMGINKAGGFFR